MGYEARKGLEINSDSMDVFYNINSCIVYSAIFTPKCNVVKHGNEPHH